MKNKNFAKINFIYFVAITLVAIVFVLGYMGVLQNEILTSFLIQIVVMLAIPLFMYSLLMKKNLKKTFSDCGLKKISTKMVIISIILGFVLYFINSFIADAFYGIITLFGYESLGSSTISLSYKTFFKEFVLSCILPGICEEFLHRGILLHANKKYTNPKTCLVISSILFGLIHLNIRQFFYATILGFLIGYTTLVADSIIPGIIIHFMNNFLSNYFVYGTHMNWPMAKFVNFVTNIFMNDIFIFIISSIVSTIFLLLLYNYLVKSLMRERVKKDIQSIIKALKMEKMSTIEAQFKFNEINKLLKNHKHLENNYKKIVFFDKIFLISSFVLGGLVTISSFIWGIL